MKFGYWYASVGPFAYPEGAVQLAQTAEAAGIESLWAGEHVVVPKGYESTYPYSETGRMPSDGAVPMAEPMVWYSFIAAKTERLRFTTGVLVLPQREPVLVAKQAATLAVLSGERFSLGIGAGWLREEFDALGADFASRARRMDEYVGAMRALWASDEADFEGEFVSFRQLQMSPRPSSGRVPIVVGGHTEVAAKRAGRLGDGFFPAKGSPEELARLFDIARETAVQHNRDPEAIEFTIHDPRALDPALAPVVLEQWGKIGVDRVLISPSSFDLGEVVEEITRFGEEVVTDVQN